MSRPAAWSDEELRLLATVYACMLSHESQQADYTKAAHNRWLQSRTNRTRSAIEFKFANLSAALEDAGMAYIPGYKPRRNRQGDLDRLVSGGFEGFTPNACVAE